jgi:hypothetical protein
MKIKHPWLLAVFSLVCFTSVGTADVLVSQNLGSQAYSASSVWDDDTPDLAFDGDLTTWWNAAWWPVGWIEVDLQANYDLTFILLFVQQTPAGETTHEIWVSDSPMQEDLSGATLVSVLTGYTQNDDILQVDFNDPINTRYVQVRTTSSPSWVAWDEIQVYAACGS